MNDPYLYMLVNASTYQIRLYVGMYLCTLLRPRLPPNATWGEPRPRSAPLPVANGIHLCQTAAPGRESGGQINAFN